MNTGSIYTTKNSNTPSIASATGALADNPARIAWTIQNLGTNALYVKLGNDASTGATGGFHIVLKAGTGNDDGNGGSVSQEAGVIYTGPISIAGTSPRYSALEIAP